MTGVRLQQSNDITPHQRLRGARGQREQLRVQRLAAPHELEQMLERGKRRILVMAAGQPPVILQRVFYYEDPHFAGMIDR